MIFDNCLIQAPDGQNLSRCSLKKLNWYLNNDLAELVSNDPPTIKLKFEPSGREGVNDPLLMEGKPNVCVVCGTDQDLTRHHIIPYSFIRYMKIEYKVDIIRDIFPLCRECHNEYEKKSWVKKKEIADMIGVPISGIEQEDMTRVRRATAAAAALIKHKDKIPEKRREYLMGFVREFLGKDEVTEEDLIKTRHHKIDDEPDFKHFSRTVASSVEDYSEFAKDWRIHFVETMNPIYMPENWKIDRKTENVWVPRRMRNQIDSI